MVLLSRIYTKGGDRGQTSLGDGSRVPEAMRQASQPRPADLLFPRSAPPPKQSMANEPSGSR